MLTFWCLFPRMFISSNWLFFFGHSSIIFFASLSVEGFVYPKHLWLLFPLFVEINPAVKLLHSQNICGCCFYHTQTPYSLFIDIKITRKRFKFCYEKIFVLLPKFEDGFYNSVFHVATFISLSILFSSPLLCYTQNKNWRENATVFQKKCNY